MMKSAPLLALSLMTGCTDTTICHEQEINSLYGNIKVEKDRSETCKLSLSSEGDAQTLYMDLHGVPARGAENHLNSDLMTLERFTTAISAAMTDRSMFSEEQLRGRVYLRDDVADEYKLEDTLPELGAGLRNRVQIWNYEDEKWQYFDGEWAHTIGCVIKTDKDTNSPDISANESGPLRYSTRSYVHSGSYNKEILGTAVVIPSAPGERFEQMFTELDKATVQGYCKSTQTLLNKQMQLE